MQQGSPRSHNTFFNEAAHYPLPASAAISPTYPRSGAHSPVSSFKQHDQSNGSYPHNQQQYQQQAFAHKYSNQNQNRLGGSGLDDSSYLRQSNPSSAYSSLSTDDSYNFPFQDQLFNLSSSVQRDSDGSGGTISPSPAQSLANANAHLYQYKSSPMSNVPSGIPAPVNRHEHHQQHSGYNHQIQSQPHQSGSALPHYLINPHALSNALSDWQNLSNGNASAEKGKGKSSTGGNGSAGHIEQNAWNSAPVSAGNSPPGTPYTGGGGATARGSSSSASNRSGLKKKNTGSFTTGTTTPGGVGLSPSQFAFSASQGQSQSQTDTSQQQTRVATSSRVASSSVTGKRLNWAEMIVFTIADQPSGRMVVHDLFEGMVKKFPEINEWADGSGWESRVKNRIKSTLSIKGNLFVKVARASTDPVPSSNQQDQKSKGSWWTLSEESRTALREGNVPAVVRAKPAKEEKALKEGSQERGRDSNHNGGKSGTSSAAHSRRSSPTRVGNAARSARGVGSGHHLSKGQQEIQAMTMTTASPKNQNHAGLYGMTSYNPPNQQYNHNSSISDSPVSPIDAASPDSVSSSRPTFQPSALAMSPASSNTSPPPSMHSLSGVPQPGISFPWVGSAASPPSLPLTSQAPSLNLGGINTPSGPGYPSGLNGLDSLTMPYDPSSEENGRHSSPTASSLSMASGSGSGSSRSRGASEEIGGGNPSQRRGGSSTSGAKPTGSRRGSLEHVSFTLPVDGSANNNNANNIGPLNPPSGPINPPNSNPSNRNLSSGEWEQLQRHQRQQLSEQRFKQQLQNSLLQQQHQQQQQDRENMSPPYRFTNPLGGGDETPSNASSIPTSPFYSFASLHEDGNGLNDLGINFEDLNSFGNDGGDINSMGMMDLDLDIDGLLMNNNGLSGSSKGNFEEDQGGSSNQVQAHRAQ